MPMRHQLVWHNEKIRIAGLNDSAACALPQRGAEEAGGTDDGRNRVQQG